MKLPKCWSCKECAHNMGIGILEFGLWNYESQKLVSKIFLNWHRCIKDSKLQTSKAKTWVGWEYEHCSKVGKSLRRIVRMSECRQRAIAAPQMLMMAVTLMIAPLMWRSPTPITLMIAQTLPADRSPARLSSNSLAYSLFHSSKLRAGCCGSRWTSWHSCRPWGWGRSQGSCWTGPSGPFSSSPPPPSFPLPDLGVLQPLPSWIPLWAASFAQKHVRSGKLGREKIPCQDGYYLDISSFMGAKDIFGMVPPECRVDDDV